MTNEELRQKIEQLEHQIKDLKVKLENKVEKEPYEVEVPEDIGEYYYISVSGDIDLVDDEFFEYDYDGAYLCGLAFKTEEEAEQYHKERILINKLKDWAKKYNKGWTPNWKDLDENKYIVTYDYDENKFRIKSSWYESRFSKLPYFINCDIAEQFIEEFGEEIKEVLC